MKQIGVYEAKTQLPRLLDEVERGETITITRHGRPVARLVSFGGQRRSVQEARGRSVKVAFVDQGYTGEQPSGARQRVCHASAWRPNA